MKSVLAVVPREEPARSEEAPPKNRSRSNALRKRILKDSRQASRGYILSFTVPAGGE